MALYCVTSHQTNLSALTPIVTTTCSAVSHKFWLLQAKRSNHTAVILFPDHTFTDWQEADTVGWEQQQYIMQKSALHTTWPKKHRQLLFRGSNTTGNRKIASELVPTDWLDIQVWDWYQEPDHAQFVGLPDHCKNKYLLNWPGNTYSARLKYLLLCGSVVVHSDNGWYEFYYPMLKHGQHLMKTKNLEDPKDFTEGLTGLVQHLQANSKKARHIAQAGQEFAEVVLSPENVREYWYRLLMAYAQKQTYKIELHSDAIPLGDSLAHPKYADVSPRPGCPSY